MLPKFENALAIAALFFLLASFSYLLGNKAPYTYLQVAFLLIAGMAATLLIARGFLLYGIKTSQGKIWGLFAAGVLFWFSAEPFWAMSSLAGASSPYPSLPDFLKMLGCIPLALGAFLAFKDLGGLKELRHKWALGLLLCAVLSFSVVYYSLSPMMKTRGAMAQFTLFYFIAADLLVLALVTANIAILGKGLFTAQWFLISIALVAKLLRDAFFAYQVAAGTYVMAPIFPDLSMILTYLLIALAAYWQMVMFQDVA